MTDDAKQESDGPRHDLKVDTSVTFECVKVKSLADGHALNTLRQPQTDALEVAREALERIASIKADDGDNFSAWPDHVIIRCEITVADLKAIRAALEARGLEIVEKGQ
jgi:hypothetical protein